MAFGDRFLTQPALFPARMAGTAGGDGDVSIDLPGGPYAIQGLSEPQMSALGERYGDRCEAGRSGGDSIRVHVFTVGDDEFRPVEQDGQPLEFDFDYGESWVRFAGRRMMAQVQWRPRLCAALWTPLNGGAEFLETFENFCRVVAAYRLLELGGAVIHSSGVTDGDRAWIFYGHSGAGKTTLARRCQEEGYTVLSDDINALFLDAERPVVAKMPFAGELGRSNDRVGPFPLAGIHGLEKAERNTWRPLSHATAVAALVGSAPFLNHDTYRVGRLMENLERVVARARAGVLAFNLNDDFWPLLEAGLPHEEEPTACP